MAEFSRGFGGRRRESAAALPPGQYLTTDFPVLSAGPTPRISLDEWEFTIRAEDGMTRSWSWEEFLALPAEDVHTDIHCVTHWSKLDMAWRGVPLDRLFEDVETSCDYVMVRSHGGYTTNLPLDDLLEGQSWIATEAEGEPLTAEHGGPARLLVPHLYFWKSAKWVREIRMMPNDDPGFWEQNGYHLRGDPWREERYW